MRKQLLGYLLGALDEGDRRRLERRLARDPQLRAQLESLRREVDLLQAADTPYEPAADLLDQTCDLVEGLRQRTDPQAADRRGEDPSPRQSPFRERRGQGGRSSFWSRADLLVTSACAVLLAALFLPALANSRFRSGITTCQHNLQVVGVAMAAYSDRYEGRFPEIPLQGNRAAAGIFGPTLIENHYLSDEGFLVCPGSTLALQESPFHVPRLAEVDRYQGRSLEQVQRAMGGSYGYSLGYIQDGVYQSPRNQGRFNYALLSDAPSMHRPRGQSDNHGGRGQNVLFEDLHVQFFRVCDGWSLGDAFFRNHDGMIRAGVDPEDTVIGTSSSHPLYPLALLRP